MQTDQTMNNKNYSRKLMYKVTITINISYLFIKTHIKVYIYVTCIQLDLISFSLIKL